MRSCFTPPLYLPHVSAVSRAGAHAQLLHIPPISPLYISRRSSCAAAGARSPQSAPASTRRHSSPQISPVSPLDLLCRAPPLQPGAIALPRSPLYLPCISPTSPLHLSYTSPTSPLHLPYISATSPQILDVVDEVAEQLALRPQLARRSSAPQLPAGYPPQLPAGYLPQLPTPSEPHGHHNGHPATSTPAHPTSHPATHPATSPTTLPGSGGSAVDAGHGGRGVISSGGLGSGSGAPVRARVRARARARVKRVRLRLRRESL